MTDPLLGACAAVAAAVATAIVGGERGIQRWRRGPPPPRSPSPRSDQDGERRR